MISVTFTQEDERVVSSEHLYQWDVGEVLKFNDLGVGTPKIHFSNKGEKMGYSIQSEKDSNGDIICAIPDQVLQKGTEITVYVYVDTGVNKFTTKMIVIPVIPRARPSDYVETQIADVSNTQSFLESIEKKLQSISNAEIDAICGRSGDSDDDLCV